MKTVKLTAEIAVTLKKTKRRSLGLLVKPGGLVELRLPYFISYQRGLVFLQKKQSWVIQKHRELMQIQPRFLEQGTREEFQQLKEKAWRILSDRMAFFQTVYGVSPKKLVIRNQKTRWGSCSRQGTVSLSYRLILLPEELRDYVIVHELCHLKEFNHSRKFWALVAQNFPHHRELRQRLGKAGEKS